MGITYNLPINRYSMSSYTNTQMSPSQPGVASNAPIGGQLNDPSPGRPASTCSGLHLSQKECFTQLLERNVRNMWGCGMRVKDPSFWTFLKQMSIVDICAHIWWSQPSRSVLPCLCPKHGALNDLNPMAALFSCHHTAWDITTAATSQRFAGLYDTGAPKHPEK